MRRRANLAAVHVEAAADQGFLHQQRLLEDGQVNRLHVVAVDPDLAHDYVGGPLAFDLGGGGPNMLGQVAQARGGRAVRLEHGLVAEQD